ncbi:PhnD/SsuA/transferrin family substrate-binding protein [Zestomonas carbonaria]|uniref:Amino acid ABC transporter substrate-binding protein, PAAT family n=1 Tax=Zestomonas carbonaria TaxID=2762745 RepID=A0A7U7IC99_9GAMM|nr:PhnD/SsuA/transferrin family substrate-binding protein [Pseudomonas carbonaria]CAD5110157.1 hypothetical protein PSEWESI4_04475 [Pseudomonas carbonaria]
MLLAVRSWLQPLSLLFFALCSLPLAAGQEVRVGAAHFPPYAERPEQGGDLGLLGDLLAALNTLQDDYRFVAVPTSLPRRYRDLREGRIDMMMFENPQWDWQDIPHIALDMGLEDSEVFVARAETGRGQDYFDDLEGKRMALFSGYHYAFAGFDATPHRLVEQFRATLTYSHDSNLKMVLRGRADIAPVTRSYFEVYRRSDPDAGQLLVSERIDQVYRHQALLRPRSPIDAQTLGALLDTLRAQGRLADIFAPYHISVRE